MFGSTSSLSAYDLSKTYQDKKTKEKTIKDELQNVSGLSALISSDTFGESDLNRMLILLLGYRAHKLHSSLLLLINQKLKIQNTGQGFVVDQKTLDEECVKAAKQDRHALVYQLLKLGANPYHYDKQGRSTLFYVYFYGRDYLAQQIVNSKHLPLEKDLSNLFMLYGKPEDGTTSSVIPGEEKQVCFSLNYFPSARKRELSLLDIAYGHFSSKLILAWSRIYHNAIIQNEVGAKAISKLSENIERIKRDLASSFLMDKKNLRSVFPNPGKNPSESTKTLEDAVTESEKLTTKNRLTEKQLKVSDEKGSDTNQLTEFNAQTTSITCKISERLQSFLKQYGSTYTQVACDNLSKILENNFENDFDDYAVLAEILNWAILYDQENKTNALSFGLIDKMKKEKLYAALVIPVRQETALHLAIKYENKALCEKLLEIAPFSQLNYIEAYSQYQTKNTLNEAKVHEAGLATNDPLIKEILEKKKIQADFYDYHLYISKRKTGKSNNNQAKRIKAFEEITRIVENILNDANDPNKIEAHVSSFVATIEQYIKSDKSFELFNHKFETEHHANILRGILNKLLSLSNQTDIKQLKNKSLAIIYAEQIKVMYLDFVQGNADLYIHELLGESIHQLGEKLARELLEKYPQPDPKQCDLEEALEYLQFKKWNEHLSTSELAQLDHADLAAFLKAIFTRHFSDLVKTNQDENRFKSIFHRLIEVSPKAVSYGYNDLRDEIIKRYPQEILGSHQIFENTNNTTKLWISASYISLYEEALTPQVVDNKNFELLQSVFQCETKLSNRLMLLTQIRNASEVGKQHNPNLAEDEKPVNQQLAILRFLLNEKCNFDLLTQAVPLADKSADSLLTTFISGHFLSEELIDQVLEHAPYTQLNLPGVMKKIKTILHQEEKNEASKDAKANPAETYRTPQQRNDEIMAYIENKAKEADLIDYAIYIESLSGKLSDDAKTRTNMFLAITQMFNEVLNGSKTIPLLIQTIQQGAEKTKSLKLFSFQTQRNKTILEGILKRIGSGSDQDQNIRKLYARFEIYQKQKGVKEIAPSQSIRKIT